MRMSFRHLNVWNLNRRVIRILTEEEKTLFVQVLSCTQKLNLSCTLGNMLFSFILGPFLGACEFYKK